MEDKTDKSNLGSIYFEHLSYPVFYIARNSIIEANNSFKVHFGEEAVGKDFFSIASLKDDNNNDISTLLDIAFNKIYLIHLNESKSEYTEGKIFFEHVPYKSTSYLVATIIFSISNDIDLSLELEHERQCRIENEDELKQYIKKLEAIDDALQKSNQRFEEMTDLLPQTVYETDFEGNIIFLNKAGEKLFGYTKDDLKDGIGAEKLFVEYEVEKVKKNFRKIFNGEKSHGNEYLIKRKDNEIVPIRAYANRVMKDGNPIGIRGVFIDITEEIEARQQIEDSIKLIKYQKEEIQEQYDFVIKQNMEIVESMNYARRIQNALLPSDETIKHLIKEYFILFKPKEIVSGDFYWITQKNGKIMMAAADCTGHGVPGAFMSMLGIAFLNEIANNIKDPSPAGILNELREHVVHTLKQDTKKITTMDGLDIALCVIDTENHEIQFAGANNPLYVVHNGELIEYPSDKMPIGFAYEYHEFSNKTIKLIKGDTFYIFSDGYMDQFGGEKNKKFKPHRFQKLIKDIHDKPMEEQKEILYMTLEEWKGEKDQVDDIIIIGFRY